MKKKQKQHLNLSMKPNCYYVWLGGSCDYMSSTRPGAGAYLIVYNDKVVDEYTVSDYQTTEFRMMLRVMFHALESLPEGAEVVFLTNVAYIYDSMSKLPVSFSVNIDWILSCQSACQRHRSVTVKLVPYHKYASMLAVHDKAGREMRALRDSQKKEIVVGLRNYVEQEILPRYTFFDAAHRQNHVETVIRQSLRLASHYKVDTSMVYVVAAYHDTGLVAGRSTHHIESARILRSDEKLKEFFTDEQIDVMADAAEDHRASSSSKPRTIYGMIVAEADRNIEAMTIVRRTIQYGLTYYPEYDKEGHYQRFLQHMHEKYEEGGYLRLCIPESVNAENLRAFRVILRNEAYTRCLFDGLWQQIHSETAE